MCLQDDIAISIRSQDPVRSDSSIQWAAYPALVLFGLFATGIIVQRSLEAGVLVWGIGFLSGIGGFAAAQWEPRPRMVSLAPLVQTAAVALVVVCVGGARQSLYETPSPHSLASVASSSVDSVSIVGTVDATPERSETTTRFTLEVNSLQIGSSFHAAAGHVRVTLRPSPWTSFSTSFPRLYQADRVLLRGALGSPTSQRNPGGFDYAAYLSRRGICCVMNVGTPAGVTVRSRRSSVLMGLLVSARRHIRTQIGRYVPNADSRAVLHALLLGDRSRISDAQRHRFAQTGLMHLLAVSGLHVFLVGMLLYTLLRPVLMRLRLDWTTVEIGRAVFTVGVLGAYMLLTGSRPSVVRAVIMSTLFIGGILFQRSAHSLNTLGVAALVLVALRPPALFDVGFQLSIAAVAGIVTLHPRLREWLPDSWLDSTVKDWFTSTVTVSAAATIGTAPVLMIHFGWVSGAGLLLNLIAIPCTGLALSASLAMVLVGEVWPVAGMAFGSGANFFVQGILFTAREGAHWLGDIGIRIFQPSVWTVGAIIGGILALAQWPRPRHRWRCLICALLFATGGVWSDAGSRSAQPTLDILFFDVGQGDAALVTTPDDRRVLVDTGPTFGTESAAISFSVLPYLRRRGIDSLHTVLVTHPDADHLGGLPTLLREVSVGRVLHSGQHVDTELFHRSCQRLQHEGIPTRAVARGDVVSFGDVVRGQVLGPPLRPRRRGITSKNGRSVVVRLTYGRISVLLPGDIEEAAEWDLVQTYGHRLRSRVVKVPHHGSETSSTNAFVDAVVDSSKTKAVVSVGGSNRFGMPDSSVVSRWRSEGAQVSSTAQEGARWFRSNGRLIWTVHWR